MLGSADLAAAVAAAAASATSPISLVMPRRAAAVIADTAFASMSEAEAVRQVSSSALAHCGGL